jgi:sporulation protein YqfC
MGGVEFLNSGTNGIAPLPGISLVEICGQNRMLIENHRGIAEYEDQKIQINVSYGRIVVCGQNLKLRKMSKEKLVITGKICCINLQGRE